jgi:SAM-dependent methyltransferase
MRMLKEKIYYYFNFTYHRRILDCFLNKYKYIYRGIVLDIGGRKRGNFNKPVEKVDKWIFADCNGKYEPDLLINVTKMPEIETETIDVINAIELFEHVDDIDSGLTECYRVLKKDGNIIISMPFLFPVHGDPDDYQRWTISKWQKELSSKNFTIDKIEIIGGYFSILGDAYKDLVKVMPIPLKSFFYIFYPLLDLLWLLDKTRLAQKKLQKYPGGYFIIAKK